MIPNGYFMQAVFDCIRQLGRFFSRPVQVDLNIWVFGAGASSPFGSGPGTQ